MYVESELFSCPLFRYHVNDRLDPFYHKPEFSALRKQLHLREEFVPIGKLIRSWNRGDGPREGFYTDDTQNGVPFLRVNNLKEHTIDLSDVKYITRHVHENTLKRAQVTTGDVVFAISGTKDNLGTVSIIPNHITEANLNSALVRFELDWSIIDKKYFCYMFDLALTRLQIDFIGKGAAQNNLNNSEISQIQIYLPLLEVQEAIVAKMDAAYAAKRQKEAEAQRLLASFEEILKQEASLELPKFIYKKVFLTSLRTLEGALNPERYAFTYQVTGNWGQISDIGSVIYEPFTPSVGFDNIEFLYLRIDDLPNNPVEPVYRQVAGKEINGSVQKISPQDVLVSRLGPTIENKKFILAPTGTGEQIVGSNEFISLRCRQSVEPLFVLGLLKTEFFNKLMIAKSRGAVPSRRRLSRSDFIKLPFPLIEGSLQKKIAREYEKRIDQAKQLQQEAVDGLVQAKQEVEAMILGE